MKRFTCKAFFAMLAIFFALSVFGTESIVAQTAEVVSTRVISEAQWDDFRVAGEGFIAVKKDGKWGFIDSAGKVVADPAWDDVGNSYGGFARVSNLDPEDPKYATLAHINSSGETVITWRNKQAVFLTESLRYANYKDGFLMEGFRGDRADDVGFFLCDVENGEFLGVTTLKSYVHIGDGLISATNITSIEREDGTYDYETFDYYCDYSGKVVLEGPYESAHAFVNGVAPVMVNGKWGFIDKSGEFIIEPVYDSYVINDTYNKAVFVEGVACVSKDNKYGLINLEGEVVSEFEWDAMTPFVNGYSVAGTSENNSFVPKVFISLEGETVEINPDLDGVGYFSPDGFAVVSVEGKYGYINNKGDIAIQPEYDDCNDFVDGVALVNKDGVYSLIDTDGNPVSDETWKWERTRFDNTANLSMYGFMSGGKWGLIQIARGEIEGAGSSEEEIAVISDGVYTIQFVSSKMFIDVKPNAAQDKQVFLASKGEKFTITRLDDGTYRIAAENGQVLDVAFGSTELGANIILWDDTSSDNQRWYIVSTGEDTYKFINKATGGVLDVLGNKKTRNTRIQQWDDNGSGAQEFELIPVR